MPEDSRWSLIGRSAWSHEILLRIRRVARHRSSVLISGPTGTGKELVARAIHMHSPRSAERFIPVDCASFSETLIASQLFGHAKGAFTGATFESLGCFRAADRGTIFLDEIGELDAELQKRLLRVIQEQAVTPLGGHDAVPIDVRIIAATNRDLKEEVVAGRFRADLYYRLNVVSLRTLPLKDRPADVKPLAEHFLARMAEEDGFPRASLSREALLRLEAYDWPGNVRELKHLLEQALIASDGAVISGALVKELLESARLPGQAATGATTAPIMPADDEASSESSASAANWRTLEEMERQYILDTLEHTFYNQSAAARLLGISRFTLMRKMTKHGLDHLRPSSHRAGVK